MSDTADPLPADRTHQVTAPAAWDPATAIDPIREGMREIAERIRNGDLPDRSAELAAETATIERTVAAAIAPPTSVDDLLMEAWGLIANAGEGDWSREHPHWKAAAERWRDGWHTYLGVGGKPTVASGQPRPETPREPWTFTRREGEPLTLAEAVGQAIGGASACWEHLARAGVFDSDGAKEISDVLIAEIGALRARDSAVLYSVDPSGAVAELVDAIRLTVEYLGTETLPPVEGWSWYDALRKYAPHLADEFLAQRQRGGVAVADEAP